MYQFENTDQIISSNQMCPVNGLPFLDLNRDYSTTNTSETPVFSASIVSVAQDKRNTDFERDDL